MVKIKLGQVSPDRIRNDLFYLSKSPLPYRKASYTRPDADINSLDEADRYIMDQLNPTGGEVRTTTHKVQAFGCDETKPLHHWYAKPDPGDPWYDVRNIEITFEGNTHPNEIIQLISHKDSMSWIDSPGAHDNATGTVVNMEIARILASCSLRRTVRILFCNEEHTPWTSRNAAETASERGDNIIAVLNNDSLDGKSDEDMNSGKMTHVVTYSTEEGKPLADFIASCASRYGISIDTTVVYKEKINDDDGMFINAGFKCTAMNLGSFPYEDSEYHLPGDIPERVNIENVVRSTHLILAAVLEIDDQGAPA